MTFSNMAFRYILQCTRWPFLGSFRRIGIVFCIFCPPRLFPFPGGVAGLTMRVVAVVVEDCSGQPSWQLSVVAADDRPRRNLACCSYHSQGEPYDIPPPSTGRQILASPTSPSLLPGQPVKWVNNPLLPAFSMSRYLLSHHTYHFGTMKKLCEIYLNDLPISHSHLFPLFFADDHNILSREPQVHLPFQSRRIIRHIRLIFLFLCTENARTTVEEE